jgi:hypothetical protein
VQRAKEIFTQSMEEACGSIEENGNNEEAFLAQRVLSLNRKVGNKETDQKLKTKVYYSPFPPTFPITLKRGLEMGYGEDSIRDSLC